MDIQQIQRMRHLWKDARAKYVSFFACLSEVRREIGDDALEEWCRKELLIGLIAINKAAGLLQDIDAARTKTELSNVAQAAKGKRELEAHAKKMEKIERQNALDAKRAENAVVKAAKAEQIKREKKAKDAAVRKQRRADKGDAIIRACGEILRDETATREEIMDRADVPRNVYDKARAKLIAERRLEQNKGTADDVSLYDQYVVEGKAAVPRRSMGSWRSGNQSQRAEHLW